MKVLYLTNIPAPYRVAFFNELGKSCDLTVLYERRYADDRNEKWLEEKNLAYEACYLPGIKISADCGFSPGVLKWLNRKKFDVIIVGGYSTPTGMLSILYLYLRKIPFLLNADGGLIGNDSLIKLNIKRFFISKASGWLSSGRTADSYLIHYGANPACIKRYPLTSISEKDVDQEPSDIKEKLCLKKLLNITEEKVVVSVGSFIPRKGFDVLIKAAGMLDDNIGIYIIGGTPPNEYLYLLKRYNVRNIHFIGFLTHHEIKLYFRASDLFVLPTRYDIWGLVVNEAMASGLPVITTDKCVAGLDLIENGKNGFIIPVDDADSLADKISALSTDAILCAEMGRRNLACIRGYTIEKMAEFHMRIICSFVSGRGDGA